MIDPAELLDALVAKWRDIPELVAEKNGDAQVIAPYHDRFPHHASLPQAIHTMPAPGILLAWTGAAAVNEIAAPWRYQLTAHVRSRALAADDPAPGNGYYRILRQLWRGIPAADGVPVCQLTIHPSCGPMEPPRIERRADAEALDYVEVTLEFLEIGDE